jgi:polysaccharide export outer membrane protein
MCSALALLVAGCAGPGQYVWYAEMPASERGGSGDDYVIGPGDTIKITVYEQEGQSVEGKIRTDGKIAMPLVGEVVAAGKRPVELARELEQRLKQLVLSPKVTVNVTSALPISVTVVGEVKRIGPITLEPPARLIDAMAQAGGPSEFANASRIFVLRPYPTYKRIRFTWESILRNEQGASAFPLRTGDVIVLE